MHIWLIPHQPLEHVCHLLTAANHTVPGSDLCIRWAGIHYQGQDLHVTVRREDSCLESVVGRYPLEEVNGVAYLSPKFFYSFSHLPVMALRLHGCCLDLKLNLFPVLFHLH